MSLGDLDPVLHAPKRLIAMAVLANTEYATFRFLKEQLDLTDSDLSKQMSALESAGYVKVNKRGRGPGSATTYTMTRPGDRAYRAHRAALYALLA
ncbi:MULTISPECIES: transcriptional regulator [unclassified Nocardioides]|uniref:transcriptional regulator n=1 Tax=unclassified Nocardioides TaxID=2615069 RepID=UPI0016429D13|nr:MULTISPECIES: transcriptional regulator [unclassified Nocardioides]MBC2934291.1 transcriptional regulator [Nocardioides sp. zg-1228]MCD4534058.1 transcriptional regulator [Nocardioides sp. cx-169]QSF59070.1 transcriptional regulator [Nocardioides sp. zg-1228]